MSILSRNRRPVSAPRAWWDEVDEQLAGLLAHVVAAPARTVPTCPAGPVTAESFRAALDRLSTEAPRPAPVHPATYAGLPPRARAATHAARQGHPALSAVALLAGPVDIAHGPLPGWHRPAWTWPYAAAALIGARACPPTPTTAPKEHP